MVSVIRFVVLGLQCIHLCMHSFATYFLNTQLPSHPPWPWGYVMNETSQAVPPTEATVWETQNR